MGKGKRFYLDSSDRKKIVLYVVGIGALCLLISAIFVLSVYRSKAEAESQIAAMEFAKDVVVKEDDVVSSSFSEDKGVNEVINGQDAVNEITERVAIKSDDFVQINTIDSNNVEEEEVEEEPEEVVLDFIVPLDGEITKDFSDSALVYSETLKEWTVHMGIDIKADKGSAVCASEAGTIESIKNDPRYGLTVTISHANGFKTVYSNLLSAEFVSEGQTVDKGQTIGSVGSSGVFEIAESEHLHFEMYEDGVCVNPASYWKR